MNPISTPLRSQQKYCLVELSQALSAILPCSRNSDLFVPVVPRCARGVTRGVHYIAFLAYLGLPDHFWSGLCQISGVLLASDGLPGLPAASASLPKACPAAWTSPRLARSPAQKRQVKKTGPKATPATQPHLQWQHLRQSTCLSCRPYPAQAWPAVVQAHPGALSQSPGRGGQL